MTGLPRLEAGESGRAQIGRAGRQALELVLFSWGSRKLLSRVVTPSDLHCKKISWAMGGEHIKANLERKKFADAVVCWQEWALSVLWGSLVLEMKVRGQVWDILRWRLQALLMDKERRGVCVGGMEMKYRRLISRFWHKWTDRRWFPVVRWWWKLDFRTCQLPSSPIGTPFSPHGSPSRIFDEDKSFKEVLQMLCDPCNLFFF